MVPCLKSFRCQSRISECVLFYWGAPFGVNGHMKIAADHPAHLAYSALNRQREQSSAKEQKTAPEKPAEQAFQLDLSKAGTRYLKTLKSR